MVRRVILISAIAMMAYWGLAVGQEDQVDRIPVKLSNPSEPIFVELGLINGGITVTGYDGDEVLVEAITRSKKIAVNNHPRTPRPPTPGRSRTRDGERRSEGESKNTEGMFRIAVNSSSLEVVEENNHIDISTNSWKQTIDINLKVPKRAFLELSCVNDGDIHVENIIGDLEINNVNGSVTLLNITGSVVAHALNEDLRVIFDGIDPEKAMSFSSLNGDIDITFPAELKCDVQIKNDQGDVYSDFEINQIEKPEDVMEENNRNREGRYEVRIERMFYGQINGGGPEYYFKNFNGDVLIRKAK